MYSIDIMYLQVSYKEEKKEQILQKKEIAHTGVLYQQ